MLSYVSKCQIALKIWNILEEYFIVESKVTVMNLKKNLRTIKKGSLTIHEYIRCMKEIYDALLSNGQSIIEKELINFVVDGCNTHKYNSRANRFFL